MGNKVLRTSNLNSLRRLYLNAVLSAAVCGGISAALNTPEVNYLLGPVPICSQRLFESCGEKDSTTGCFCPAQIIDKLK